ncbi:MAG TPA: class I SAM-dependent methyltransferase [Gaiellaceae bacterium]|nr:class I SAM-dependent methyltransferase [Gaiellaceae bacterium]
MTRELGRSFGSAVEDYVRGRPGWPIQAVEAPGISPKAHVLDLAAGTGKLTQLLSHRFARVSAVEPDDAMRAANRWGEPLAGSAEAIPLPDDAVEAVFVAEAFHWFGKPAVVRELERVLRPAGTVVLLWNRPRPETAIPAEVHALMEGLTIEADRNLKRRFFYSAEWRDVFRGSAFGPIEQAAFDHEHVLDRTGLVSYFLSQSKVTERPSGERAAIRADLERLIPEGSYVRPLRAEVYWTQLLSGTSRGPRG